MENNKFKNYIEDCLYELIIRTAEAQTDVQGESSDFSKGRAMAYNEVISYLISQTELFEIKNELKGNIKNFIPPL